MNGLVINDNKEMAGVLNNYFTSVYTREMDGPVPVAQPLHSDSVISDIKFDAKKVRKKTALTQAGLRPGSR